MPRTKRPSQQPRPFVRPPSPDVSSLELEPLPIPCCTMVEGKHEGNYTSIDPKQFQSDSFRPISVKNRFLGAPYFHPKSKLFHQ